MSEKFTPMRVEVNSSADQASGKKLFEAYGEEIERQGGLPSGQLEAVGIVEQGTFKKKTSIALLCRITLDGETMLCCFETTAALFMAASLAVHGSIRKFEPPDTKNKD